MSFMKAHCVTGLPHYVNEMFTDFLYEEQSLFDAKLLSGLVKLVDTLNNSLWSPFEQFIDITVFVSLFLHGDNPYYSQSETELWFKCLTELVNLQASSSSTVQIIQQDHT